MSAGACDRSPVALVTGGASGIGRAVALQLAARAAEVWVADIDGTGAAAVAAEIERAGGARGRSEAVDVADRAAVDGLVAAVLARAGRLDVAVNCAGVSGVRAPTADYPEAVWRRVLDVDLTGAFHCVRAEVAAMVAGGGGAIVTVASGAGVTGVPGSVAYVAAKHGVVGLTRTAAVDHARAGVRVNCICPGLVDTPMNRFDTSAFAAAHPIGRAGRPEEIARAADWLCSDAASFVTGAVVAVDGGLLAGIADPVGVDGATTTDREAVHAKGVG